MVSSEKYEKNEKGVLTINGSNDNKGCSMNAPPAMNEERNLMMRSFTIPTTFYSFFFLNHEIS